MKYSEIHKKLKEAGCHVVRNGSRHPIWESPITGKPFPTSYHEAQEAKKGTVKAIRLLSGVNI